MKQKVAKVQASSEDMDVDELIKQGEEKHNKLK